MKLPNGIGDRYCAGDSAELVENISMVIAIVTLGLALVPRNLCY